MENDLEGGEIDQNYSSGTSSKGDKHRNASKNSSGFSQAAAQQAHPPTGGQSGGYHGQRHSHGPPNSGGQNPMQQHHMDYDPFPVVYSAHKHGQIHQYKCKYPGCNQVMIDICVYLRNMYMYMYIHVCACGFKLETFVCV